MNPSQQTKYKSRQDALLQSAARLLKFCPLVFDNIYGPNLSPWLKIL